MSYQEIIKTIKASLDETISLNGIEISPTFKEKLLILDEYIKDIEGECLVSSFKRKATDLCFLVDNFNFDYEVEIYRQEYDVPNSEKVCIYINKQVGSNKFKECGYYSVDEFFNDIKNNYLYSLSWLNWEIGICVENYVKKRVYTYSIPKSPKILFKSSNVDIVNLNQKLVLASYPHMIEQTFDFSDNIKLKSDKLFPFNRYYYVSEYGKAIYFENVIDLQGWLLNVLYSYIPETVSNISVSLLHCLAGICQIDKNRHIYNFHKIIAFNTFCSFNMPIPQFLHNSTLKKNELFNINEQYGYIIIDSNKLGICHKANMIGDYIELPLNHKNISRIKSMYTAREIFSDILKFGKFTYNGCIFNGIIYKCLMAEFYYEGKTLIRENSKYEDIVGDLDDEKWVKFSNNLKIPEKINLKYNDKWDGNLVARVYITECLI